MQSPTFHKVCMRTRTLTSCLAIAYSLLAGIPAVSGLYSMLVASAIYPLLASWPHGGPAPFSILELMSGATAEEIMELYHSRNGTEGYSAELLGQVTPSTIVSTLTFTIGLIYVSQAKCEASSFFS